MRLWHDDVRPAPQGWVWVQNNQDARDVLSRCVVSEISMDHDLAPYGEAGIMARGWDEDNGLKLVEWMVEHRDVIPQKIFIHSWNAPAAKRMAQALAEAGHVATIRPFDPHEHGYI